MADQTYTDTQTETAAALRAEGERLLALADQMESVLPATARQAFQPWRGQVRAWLANPKLETLDGEAALEHLSLDLRRLWLTLVHAQADGYMMSPPHAQPKTLPGDARIGYPYDRWLKPHTLEAKLRMHRPTPAGWLQSALMFSSGMSAIATVVQYLRTGLDAHWPRPDTPQSVPLSLHWFGGYFEIARLLQLACDTHMQGRRHSQQATLFETVRADRADIFVIEPVAADFDLEVFDLDGFLEAWAARDGTRPCAVLVDTSLTGDAFPMDRLLEGLAAKPPALVMQATSGLKLDQEGLELANAGLLTVYMPARDADGTDASARLANVASDLRVARTTFGAGLTQNQCAALSAPFFLDGRSLPRHTARVFAANAAFARALAPLAKPATSQEKSQGTGALIVEVRHPALDPARKYDWAQAPFVNVRYAADTPDDRNVLRAVLEFEARKRGLTFASGSSFGFRAHRFEMGFVRERRGDTLRVALGSRNGPSLAGVIKLFQDLAAYPTFAALRAAYPDIAASMPRARRDEEQ